MQRSLCICLIMLFVFVSASGANAQSAEELARIAEEKAKQSSDADLTWDEVYDKLDQACEMLKNRGLEKGLDRMQGDSPYIFRGTYVWVHDLDFIMLMHPIKPELNGKNIKNDRDSKGKLLFQEMNERVQVSPGNITFVDYHWPKPGVEDKNFPKRSVVQMCEVDGKKIVVGCGKYLK